MYALVTLFVAVVIVSAYQKSQSEDKLFVAMFSFSTFYYSQAGYYYWSLERYSEYLGVYWGEELFFSAMMLSIYSCLVLIVVGYFVPTKKNTPRADFDHTYFPKYPFLTFLLMGGLGALYVLARSSSIGGGLDEEDPVMQIAGQFSDFLIPCILFNVARRGLSLSNIALIVGYITYATIVGFRAKLTLIFLPLGYMYWMSDTAGGLLKQGARRSIIVIMSVAVVILFSFMTFARRKFSGVDMDDVLDADFDLIVFGFFAETNTLFGLSAVFTEYVDIGKKIYLKPIFDIFIEWIPRFIYPDKITGEYLKIVVRGLLSPEAEQSGTAYPFVGEYLLMGGYFGAFVGCLAMVAIYCYLRSKLVDCVGADNKMYYVGTGLLAIFFGYYYYSRGFLPQAVKAGMFSIFPFYYLMYKLKARR